MSSLAVNGVLFYLLIVLHIAESKSGYMLTFPSELQIGASERFCLTLYNVTSDLNLSVNISCFGKEINHKPKTFRAGEYHCFSWTLPDTLTAGTCNLGVNGETDSGQYSFSESQDIQLVDTNQITFIQTDRPVYKPKDRVRFRVLSITQDLLPVLTRIESVAIKDPNGYFMKEWVDIPVQAGLVSLDYQLYDGPVLGTWTISANVRGRKTEQEFTVQEYVLPTFQVTTTLPKVLNVETKSLTFKVCASYTFGKPVEGDMVASVCLRNTQSSWFCEAHVRPCAAITKQIFGCHEFSLETEKFDIANRKYSLLCEPQLALDVNVTEKATGVMVRETAEGIKLKEERVQLKFVSPKYFKPYFPYIGKLQVRNQDGSPSAREMVVLTISKLGLIRSLTTDDLGYANFTIQNLTHSMDFFTMKAKTTDYEIIDKEKYTIFPASTELHVKQWYSPTSSHIQLSSNLEGPLQCGSHVNIQVAFTLQPGVVAEKLFYQVISKGHTVTGKDITSQTENTRPFIAPTKGPVLSPKIEKSTSHDNQKTHLSNKDQLPERLYPQGPPGSDNLPAGPPGSKLALAGPPAINQNYQQQHPQQQGPPEKVSVLNKTDEDTSHEWVAPFMWALNFDLHVTHEMFPIMRVLVYMVTSRGEMVADTLYQEVVHCHRNKVKMSFSEKSARPGDSVQMSVTAPPHSLCSTTVVDKRAYLLGGVNLLQDIHVNERLSQLDLTSDFLSDWRYCSSSSDMPPLLSPTGGGSGQGYDPAGPPGFYDKTPFGPFLRKKRSLMQFYSNMYDSLLAFKVAGMTALTDLDLQTRPCLHDGDHDGSLHSPGDPNGPVPGFGNLDELKPADEPVDRRDPVSRIRKNFPENWLWDLYEIPSSGSVSLNRTLPDSVTEWVGNSFCSNEEEGLGVSQLVRLMAFQPYFMSVKIPYSAVRGEKVHVDVMTFNFMSHCLAIEISLLGSKGFQRVAAEDGQFCICTGQTHHNTFTIRPTDLSSVDITVKANVREHRIDCRKIGAPRGFEKRNVYDIVTKVLHVVPEGVLEEDSISEYICPQDFGSRYEKSLHHKIPMDLIVPGSLKGWVSVIGDIMGPVLTGNGIQLQMPMGCGEQNMARLAPNIAVLRYLTSINQLDEHLEINLLDNLYNGYQQQMKFMHPDGSYSAFGGADDKGSTWLSAFVFKTLQLSLDFMYIDRKQIQTKTWEFLLTQQAVDGCFNEDGKVLSKYMMGGVVGNKQHQRKALTAYVLVAMLESFKMMREQTPPFIALAVRCIEAEQITDTYTLALTSYAMALYKPNNQFTERLINSLKAKAVMKDGMMYWERENQPDILSGQGRAASAEVEITSYALMALLTKNENISVQEVIPIVTWLTKQRGPFGAFASTQDTVVALQALSLFARRIYGNGLDVMLSVTSGKDKAKYFKVLPSNNIILQKEMIDSPESELVVKAEGDGCVLFQASYIYNVKNTVRKNEVFTIDVTTPITMEIINNNCRTRLIQICSSYTGTDGVSNMVLVKVKLLSGWIPNTSTLDSLLNSVELGLKKYELDRREPDNVVFYLDELSSTTLCFDFTVVLEVEVEDPQPAYVTVVDYYETDTQMSVPYSFSECSESKVQKMDVQVKEDDLYIEETPLGNQPADFSFTNIAPMEGSPAAGVVQPITGPQCPECVNTGVVNILDRICSKQVWVMERHEDQLSVQFVASVGVSPPVNVPIPVHLKHCDKCQELLLMKGKKSMVVLEITNWEDLAKNLMNTSTVVLPWSKQLQLMMQSYVASCETV